MIEITKKQNCSGCGACFNICPKECIHMEQDEEGFLYPSVDKEKCIQCGACEKVCIELNQTCTNNQRLNAYVVKNKHEDIRRKSSSGGMFSALSTYILKNGGVVFGATQTEDLLVKHKAIFDEDELDDIRGAKYLQSNVGTCYKQAKKFLDKGLQVLFSGTPCQIYGLKAFLKKEYENLITVSVVCHGVPSAKIFETFLCYGIKKKNGESIEKVLFRDKLTGWKNYSVTFQTNKRAIHMLHDECPYMRGYLSELYSRPSCHQCVWKQQFEKSDVILGDAWGIQNLFPEIDDDAGISYVLLGTSKGEMLLQQLEEEISLWPIKYEECLKYNPSIYFSKESHPKRKEFFSKLTVKPEKVNRIIKSYTRRDAILFIKIKMSMILKKTRNIVGGLTTRRHKGL